MDDLKQKLNQFYEQIEPTEEFLERLKKLEDEPAAVCAPRTHSRRRYLLPIAAMLAVAVAVGGGWRYLKATMPSNLPATEPVYSEPAAQPAAPEAPDSTAEQPAAKPQLPDAPEEPAPAPAKEAQPPEESPAPEGARTESLAPPPAEQPGPAAPRPDETPAEGTADDPLPEDNLIDREGADPAGTPEPVNSLPDLPPEDTPKPDDPPEDVPKREPTEFIAGFYSDGDQDYVSITNGDTGESVTIELTGSAPEPEAPSQPDDSSEPPEPMAASYCFQRSAFGQDVNIFIVRYTDGSAQATACSVS